MYADAMEAVKELLLEALNDLSEEDLPKFQWHLQFIRFQKGLPQIPFSLLEFAKMTFILDVVVETCGLRSLEVTREIFKDMQRTDLVHKLSKSSAEATVEAVKGLLLETLKDLNEEDLMDFKWFLQFKYFLKDPQIPCWQLKNADRKFIIDLIVKVCRQQSLDITTEVFRDMNRMDLVQRLSKSSSGFKEKDQVYERWPALIHNVEEMTSLVELLLETLADLSHREVKDFKVVLSRNYFSVMPWSLLKVADQQDIVFFMVQTFGQQSVPEIMECLKEMKRTDLAQRLSDCSSEPKKKYVDEHLSPMIHNEATVEAVKELLLETLEDLSEEDLEHLICFLQFTRFQNGLPQIPLSLLEYSDLTFIIDLIVEMCGQQSLEVTTELFRDINRMDLVQRLSKSSSGFKDKPSVDKRYCGLIQKVATVAAVKHLLLGALNDLSNEELDEFERFLDLTNNWKNLHYASGMLNHLSIRAIIVNLMVDQHGQPSVEVTREVFMHMNKTDLVQKLPESSSASREKHSVDEHGAALLKRDEALAVVEEIILETLKDLSHKEIKKFRLLVLFTCSEIDLPEMEKDTTDKVVHHMVDELGLQSLEVTREVLTDMNKTDLAQSLLELTKRFKGQETKRSFKPEQDSSDWTKLEPEVNSTDADEAPTYSLQSAAGHFECRVSGLRWVCKGKTSFQYQFRSWEGHMERMESRQYMPAGPLMDVTVTAGKLIEVHLPHWICIDDIPDILDMFAVVHIDDCGDVVEKVSEVTPTHVKLTEPHFSLLAALIRFIFPPKISCYTLMYYKPNTSFLKLHVYLIRQDPALEQVTEHLHDVNVKQDMIQRIRYRTGKGKTHQVHCVHTENKKIKQFKIKIETRH